MIDSRGTWLRSPSPSRSPQPVTFMLRGGGETTHQCVDRSGNEAIGDWVWWNCGIWRILNRSSEPQCAIATRWDVVGTDGTSDVIFQAPAGRYFVAIRHRNHLGCMTAADLVFTSGTIQTDFTTASLPTYGMEARATSGARTVLWQGDVSGDGVVKYVGSDNDRDLILVTIGGVSPTQVVQGYHPADVNLDGRVKYTGQGNDRDRVLITIGGLVPTNIREAQLPGIEP